MQRRTPGTQFVMGEGEITLTRERISNEASRVFSWRLSLDGIKTCSHHLHFLHSEWRRKYGLTFSFILGVELQPCSLIAGVLGASSEGP